MNSVFLIGNISSDITVRQTASGTSCAKFVVAIDRPEKGKGTDFIACTAWGTTAENVSRFFSKGQRIGITGHLRSGSYEKEGRREFTLDVIVDRFDFIERREKTQERQREPGEEYNEPLPF